MRRHQGMRPLKSTVNVCVEQEAKTQVRVRRQLAGTCRPQLTKTATILFLPVKDDEDLPLYDDSDEESHHSRDRDRRHSDSRSSASESRSSGASKRKCKYNGSKKGATFSCLNGCCRQHNFFPRIIHKAANQENPSKIEGKKVEVLVGKCSLLFASNQCFLCSSHERQETPP